ncbi:FHA domain-containing protein [Massilia sp. IC2-278]|uniref:FHA domain-containing protein n=1 Tax=Massilia sp. IC2-278 TaxID=2887200 RepID=UPI001E51D1F5|nr:FHA domain-containing protein [Massilia sp. IC2-278]MCC2959343.1 FHA domain-containing protein [Massilia sp. IC2-278]
MRIVRWLAAGILSIASALTCASAVASLGTLVLRQSAPGVVIVSGQLAGAPPPRAGDLRLLLPDGTEVAASELSTGAGPGPEVWLALCLDHSGSMSSSINDLKDGLAAAVHSALSGPDARLRIQTVAFASEVQPVGDFSANADEIVTLIDALPAETARDGRTRLYDALATALANLKEAPAAASRHLLVVSDGKDEGSAATPEDIARDAAALGVPLDTIAYGALAPGASAALRSLAQASSGQFVLAGNPAELTLAIQGLLQQPPSARVDMVFRYPPAPDRPAVGSAALIHAAPGAAPARYPVRLVSAIAAPMKDAAAGPVPELVAVAVAATALAVIGCVVLWKRRGKTDADTGADTDADTVDAPAAAPREPDAGMPGRSRRNTVVGGSFAAPEAGRPSALLLCMNGLLQGQRLPIEHANVRLGASPANELVLSGDEFVSREHASIRYDAGHLYLQDLDSANGTYLNGQRVGSSAMPLAPGDQIRLGRTTLQLQPADSRLAGSAQPPSSGRQPTLVRSREDSQR